MYLKMYNIRSTVDLSFFSCRKILSLVGNLVLSSRLYKKVHVHNNYNMNNWKLEHKVSVMYEQK